MSVPFLDLTRQHGPLRGEIDAALSRVLDSGQYILGPETAALERALAERCGVPHAIAVASGTDAILLALVALGAGPGAEVVTTPFTFMATGGAVARTGARPVFADIDPETYNLDPALAEAAVTPRTRALLPVDLYGLCADWARFEGLAAARGVALVEDAAQSMGARCDGRPAGAFGDAAAFSFYPTKNLGGMGDGGLVTTRRADVAERIRLLRAHGDAGGYDHREVGMNSRLDAFQAAVLLVKASRLDAWNDERRRIAARYTRRLLDLFPGGEGVGRRGGRAGPIVPPTPAPAGSLPIFHQYVVRAERRAELMTHLRSKSIGCAVYYPTPLHLQPCFRDLGYRKGSFPESERAAAEALALPIFPGLTEAEQDEVCGAIDGFFRGRG
ncbi:MAG: DegT/DnrJ/EryC1/StrS family aminotransferase [Acidobacteria bacterium]|nr:DegT/DnrJ/EryC1/StrS family aminotransferase [Acidobacteriota bacterium]